MTILRRAGTALAAVLLLAGASGPGCMGLRFDREAMLGAVADTVIIPAHLELVAATEALDAAARRFTASPNPESLAALRVHWLGATLAWKGVELYDFPGLLLLHNAIERRPARIPFIEEVIAGADPEALGEMDGAFVESLGSTTKGIAAIEYLIFPAGEEPPALDRFADPSRRAFLTALTENLSTKAAELHRHWTPEGTDYARSFRENDSEGADIQGSVSLLANEMIALLEMVMRTRLGIPMGDATEGEPRPAEVESARTGESLAMMSASLASIRETFEAGVDDYVDFLDRAPTERGLAQAIRNQFGAVERALSAIPGPLGRAVTESPAEVALTFEAMRGLLVLVKTDMAAVLGITVTFSDNDGD